MDLFDRSRIGFETVTIENPDAGQPVVWYSPEDTRVLVTSVVFTFTTDANVADRWPYVNGDQGHIDFGISPVPAAQTASNAFRYALCFCALGIDASTEASALTAPLNPHLYLEPKDSLRINALNIQAGDQFSAIWIRYAQKLPR